MKFTIQTINATLAWNESPNEMIERKCVIVPADVPTEARKKAIEYLLDMNYFYAFESNEPILGQHQDFKIYSIQLMSEVELDV